MNPESSPVVGFIGCGKLGTAILQGLLRDPTAASRILISVQSEASATRLRSLTTSTPPIPVEILVDRNTHIATHATIIFLACKSSHHAAVLAGPGLAAALEHKTLLSTLGGVPSASLRALLPPRCTVLRAVPSVAAAIGASTTLLERAAADAPPRAAGLERLLRALGPVRVVPARALEAGVVATASSPAFFAALLEAVARATTTSAQSGVGADEARAWAAGAMGGAAAMVAAGVRPAEVVRRVATAGGSTEAGLRVLGERGVAEAVEEAVWTTLRAAERLGGGAAAAAAEGGGGWSARAVGGLPGSMDAVVFRGVRRVAVERRPVPRVCDAGDVIVRVKYSGLCGSDLHLYRGKEECGTDFILGHEFTGTVVEVGGGVKSFRPGDLIVCPFTTSCARCFFCRNGTSSRCKSGQVFGTPTLGGAQAEYVRVPLADTSAVKAPQGVSPRSLVLMADIFPTGFYAAKSSLTKLPALLRKEAVVAVLGCGPVGLCALVTASTYKPKHILTVDHVQERRETSVTLGAEAWSGSSDRAEMDERINVLTDGRGVDIVLEAVGSSSALQLAFEIVRPGGVITSVGVHSESFPFTAAQAYDKNVQLQIGRCPVSSVFTSALECFRENEKKLEFLTKHVVPLSEAAEHYKAYDQMKVQKVIFDAEEEHMPKERL
ncbi:alcohol dehydrogenase [Botryosphaeria dothidea]|uniref:Alcohol dehydrogenase n=1 Tax=Botryosphaeria dothidea TaxID=55169 RepID=A0A8H4IMK5_9PEZI|nr:alcohol dehydrogenase [Botryosphaeria dothidea]